MVGKVAEQLQKISMLREPMAELYLEVDHLKNSGIGYVGTKTSVPR